LSFGYLAFALGMVITQGFNGAGDTMFSIVGTIVFRRGKWKHRKV
jgi:Na+-driven multidrug efflux pump